jgi:hypothetical protein
MKDIQLQIDQPSGQSHIVHISCKPEDTLDTFANRITERAEVDGHAILEMALDMVIEDTSRSLHDLPLRHRELKFHRVCVAVHFETEEERHWFPVQARWARVHRWACRKFEVSVDACANLELREDSPEGSPVNEREPIGKSEQCKTVWLVKPGPEQNG